MRLVRFRDGQGTRQKSSDSSARRCYGRAVLASIASRLEPGLTKVKNPKGDYMKTKAYLLAFALRNRRGVRSRRG